MLPHFAPKKSHFKAKLACFLRLKHVNYFSRESSALNWCITHTKPTKNEVKIFVSCTLQQTLCIFFCLAQGVEFSDELKNELKVKGNSYECIQLLFFFLIFLARVPTTVPSLPSSFAVEAFRAFWPEGVSGIVSGEFSTTESC